MSADRRGTLSMPDLESFIVNPNAPKNAGKGSKRKKTTDELALDIEMSINKKGTKSRPS